MSMNGGAHRPQPGFVLCVSRLMAYKNVGAVIEAFVGMTDVRLVVVGQGPDLVGLQASAGPNVSLLGRVLDAELDWLYANCAGVVSASYEDFGLTAIEAATYGKPSAVLRYGGFLDTVIEGETGVFFDEPIASDIAQAVHELLEYVWDTESITRQADCFTESSFVDRLGAAVGVATTHTLEEAVRPVGAGAGRRA
jgi:glycosyltransferase involved in cell wall biosynthesis